MDSTNGEARAGEAERPQESGAASPARSGRMSRQRKIAAVLRLLRGEDLETVSRNLGVTASTLSGWRDAFVAAGEAVLTTKTVSGEELQSERPKEQKRPCHAVDAMHAFGAKHHLTLGPSEWIRDTKG